MFYFYLICITATDVSALIFARYFAQRRESRFLIASLASFAMTGYFYVHLMGFAVTPIINIIYVAFSTLVVTLFYHFVFKEKITPGQGVGVVLVIFGLYFLQ